MNKLLFLFLIFASQLLYAQEATEYEEADEEVILDQDIETEEGYEEAPDVEHELVAPSTAATTSQYKKEKIYHKGFDETKWRDIVGESNFEQAPEEPQFLTPSFQGGSEILKAIGYAVIVAIVILLLYFVFKNIKITTKVKKPGIAPFASGDPEDIHDLDIDGLLKQALAEGNLKMAVRLYFLLLLKNLDESGLIRWEKDKTNREYLAELFSSEAYYDDVRRLTLGYEEVWYGDHRLPEESLRSLINKFETLQGRLKPSKLS